MKKTQLKDASRNITKRIVSYLSVCLVVMLGLGGFFTTRYLGAGLNERGTEFYAEHNFKDYVMMSSYGITDANLEKIKQVDKVIDAEGVVQADGTATSNGKQRNVTVISITERVSVPTLTGGEMPKGTDECIIGEDFAENEGLKVGDKLIINLSGLGYSDDETKGDLTIDGMTDADGSPISLDDEEDEEDEEDDGNSSALYSKEFTITGLMIHPDYLKRNVTNTVGLPLDAFNTEVTDGLYTRAFVRTEEPEGVDLFTDEFFEATADTQKALEDAAEELKIIRTQEVKDKFNEQIDEAWEKADAKLQEGQDEIDSSQEELDSKLASGRKKLKDAEKLLAKKIREANNKLKKGELTLAEYKKKLAAGKKEYAASLKQYEEGKKQLEESEKQLESAEKEFAEKKAKFTESKQQFDEMMSWVPDTLVQVDTLIEDWQNRETDEYKAAEKAAAKAVTENQAAVMTATDADVIARLTAYARQIYADTGVDVTALIEELKKFSDDTSAAALISDAGKVLNSDTHFTYETLTDVQKLLQIIEDARTVIAQIETKLAQTEAVLAQKRQELEAGKKLLAESEKKLAAAAKAIEDGEKQIAAAKKKLKDSRKKLKSETAKAEEQIEDGWESYYSKKKEYEDKIADAVALLADNRELAEEKLAEAREEVEDIDSCEWAVLGRKVNTGYASLRTNLNAVRSMGSVFGVLFTIITAVVCFSTLVIIIDEQKKMVGTTKAFGFYKREILGKYMVFGVTSAVLGSILGTLLGWGLSSVVQVGFDRAGMYSMGVAKSVITPALTIFSALLIIAVTVAATVAACSGILKSPASMLMNGIVLKREKKGKKKKDVVSSKGGTLYSRLIIRNMKNDKARVIVTIAIIACSCMLIGVGINVKTAYDGMMNRQETDINKYDLCMKMNDDVTEVDEKQLTAVLDRYGTDYLGATSESLLYRWGGKLDGLQLICASPEKLGDFYAVTDYKTGSEIELPEDGILIQNRMHESYGMNAGGSLTILDSDLKEHKALIKGFYANYVGRTVVMSPAVYKDVFGSDPETNVYYIKLNGADTDDLEENLLAVTANVSFESDDEFRSELESESILYNILVFITTGIAILLSVVILTNLASIYMSRKRKELTVMRINGFTVKETKGYLLKETVFTTTAGLIFGVAMGALIAPGIIGVLQQPDVEYIKSFQPLVWGAAAAIETLFSIIINRYVFNKVKDLNLQDLT